MALRTPTGSPACAGSEGSHPRGLGPVEAAAFVDGQAIGCRDLGEPEYRPVPFLVQGPLGRSERFCQSGHHWYSQMSPFFLSGLTAAWAVTQVGLGAVFVLAYLLRRQSQHLLFGLVCIAFAVVNGGLSLAYGTTATATWLAGTRIAFAGATAAIPLNLHFVLRFARAREERWLTLPAYALAGFFESLMLTGVWPMPEDIGATPESFRGSLALHGGAPTLGWALGGFSCLALVACFLLLLRAYRSGRADVRGPLAGAAVLIAAIIWDLAGAALARPAPLILPHLCLVYSGAVALSLLIRFRDASGQLEATTRNLQQTTEELRQSHLDLESMEAQLGRSQQLAAVGELAAAIAHEVRNPLAVIVNAVVGLRRQDQSEAVRNLLLGIVDEEVARLNRLVNDLLRFARPVSVSYSDVSVRELAERTAALVGAQHRVAIEIPPIAELETIALDAGLFRLVLENLVENACQAMPDEGTLTVAVKPDELDGSPAACVQVRDTGHGMSPQTLQQATKPFFTTRPSGTGLGLPIVERIMQAHGGALRIESAPSRGTTVSLVIPLDPVVRRRRRRSALRNTTASEGR